MCDLKSLYQKLNEIAGFEKIFKIFSDVSDATRKGLWHRKRSLGRSKFNYIIQHLNLYSGFILFRLILPTKLELFINSQSVLHGQSFWEFQYFTKSILLISIFSWILDKLSYTIIEIFDAETKKSLQIMVYHGVLFTTAFFKSGKIVIQKIANWLNPPPPVLQCRL